MPEARSEHFRLRNEAGTAPRAARGRARHCEDHAAGAGTLSLFTGRCGRARGEPAQGCPRTAGVLVCALSARFSFGAFHDASDGLAADSSNHAASDEEAAALRRGCRAAALLPSRGRALSLTQGGYASLRAADEHAHPLRRNRATRRGLHEGIAGLHSHRTCIGGGCCTTTPRCCGWEMFGAGWWLSADRLAAPAQFAGAALERPYRQLSSGGRP